MFDNLREDSGATPFYEEEAKFQAAAGTQPDESAPARRLFGMTPIQRFVIALLLFFAVCSLGAMCLFVTGKISLP